MLSGLAASTGLDQAAGLMLLSQLRSLLTFPWPPSLVAQLVKNPPAMCETWVRSLGWEDILEKGMATHSSILAWRFPWTVPWGCKELDMTERLSLYPSWRHLSCEPQTACLAE